MTAPRQAERVAIIWQLTWTDDSVLACSVYRDGHGLQLRLESNSTLIVSEQFDMQPRAVARARALRDSLKRRGWQDPPASESSKP
jgi:hypothetical protein